MTVIAHISDVHLPQMPFPRFGEMSLKQFFGFLNWHWSRKSIHNKEVLALILDDLKGQPLDHLIVSGDIVNLALRGEIAKALGFMKELERPGAMTGGVSYVAGNHDYYAGGRSFQLGGPFAPYMATDQIGASLGGGAGPVTPFVRLVNDVAVIGVNSAIPTPLFKAFGEVSQAQLDQLAKILEKAKRHGFYRCVVVHHPPLEGLCSMERAMLNAADFTRVIEGAGAELVLYGHLHRQGYHRFKTADGAAHITGVPSASAANPQKVDLARYNLFHIQKTDEGWTTQMIGRGLDQGNKRIVRVELIDL